LLDARILIMARLALVGGFVLIGGTVWEVFKDLFHAPESGALRDWIGRHLFNAFSLRTP
jgi:hypothetical protein